QRFIAQEIGSFNNVFQPLLPKHNTVAREYAERTLDKENVLRQFINDIRG
ncbi:hypothetical protein ACUOFC_54115, partial [Escherichia sp. TWPC-MK]